MLGVSGNYLAVGDHEMSSNNHQATNYQPACVKAVILSYNSQQTLTQVIAAVQEQSHPVANIIVVDNGSQDGTAEYLQQNFAESQLILLPKNMGVGHGHNCGWQAALVDADCEFIWSLEHDSIPDVYCLESLVEAYRNHPQPHLLGAICPYQEGNYTNPTGKGVYLWKGGTRFGRLDAPNQVETPYNCRSLTFNGTLFPVAVVRRVGLLRTDFFLGHEDFDYAERLTENRLRLLLAPKAVVYHDVLRACKKVRFLQRIIVLPDQNLVREYYSTRNAIVLQRSRLPASRLWLVLVGQFSISIFYILTMKNQKSQRILSRFYSIRDGLQGKMGCQNYSFLK